MGSSSSKDTKKLNGTPTFRGTMRTPLFNGLLYRIIDERTGTWGFYSDSKEYEFHITYLFGAESSVEAIGQTELNVQDDGILCTVVVYPLETEMFVVGNVDGFESKIEALPLSEDYLSVHPEIDDKKYYRRLMPPKAKQF